MARGWAGCRAMAGRLGLLPCPIATGSSCGSSALSPERSPRSVGEGAVPFSTTPLAASPRPGRGKERGGRWEAQARLQREQDPGCARSSPLLKARMEQQPLPTARDTHAGPAGQDTPRSHHPPHACREERECPALWCGMWSRQGTEWPLLHQQLLRGSQRCEGPASAEWGLWSGGSPAMAQSSPTTPPASPPLLGTHK